MREQEGFGRLGQDGRYYCSFDECEKSYETRYGLKRHYNATHLDIKRFRCKYCDKRFSQKIYCIEHEFKHEGRKPYVCDYPGCNVTFRQKSSYFRHIKKDHQGGAPN